MECIYYIRLMGLLQHYSINFQKLRILRKRSENQDSFHIKFDPATSATLAHRLNYIASIHPLLFLFEQTQNYPVDDLVAPLSQQVQWSFGLIGPESSAKRTSEFFLCARTAKQLVVPSCGSCEID